MRNSNDANTVFGFSLFKLSLPLPVHQTLTLYHVDFISYNHINRSVEAPGPPATHFRALLGLNVLPQAVFKHQSCFGGWECENSFEKCRQHISDVNFSSNYIFSPTSSAWRQAMQILGFYSALTFLPNKYNYRFKLCLSFIGNKINSNTVCFVLPERLSHFFR